MIHAKTPITVANIEVKRISEEKAMICSVDTAKEESNKIKAASRVPIPETEIGKSVIRPVTVKENAKYKKGTFKLQLLVRTYICK